MLSSARIVARDQRNDLALLKLTAQATAWAVFRDGRGIRAYPMSLRRWFGPLPYCEQRFEDLGKESEDSDLRLVTGSGGVQSRRLIAEARFADVAL